MMELRASEGILSAGFADLEAGTMPGSVGSWQNIRIESRVVSDSTRARTPVAEMYRNATIGVPWQNPRRTAELSSPIVQLDHVGVDRAALAAGGSDPIAEAQPLRRGRTDQHRIIPGQLRKRLGQFLEPTVVGE